MAGCAEYDVSPTNSFFVLELVPACSDGSTWWRQDGHLPQATEPVQPHQHDLPTGM